MRTPTSVSSTTTLLDNGTASASEDASPITEHLAEEVIPLAEEEVRVGKRVVTTGRVRVRTFVDVVQEPVRASLEEETVEVTRVPVGLEISQAPEVRTENGVTIVPVVEEVLVIEKRLILKEELHIRRITQTEDVEIPVELRKQRAEVERLPAGEGSRDGK
jgi:stress response protein YsnF